MAIGIIRRNGLGDVICSLPLLYLCQQQMPQTRVTLFVDERSAALAPYLDGPQEIIVMPGGGYGGLVRLAWKERRRRFDLLISAKPAPMKMVNFLMRLLRAKRRIACGADYRKDASVHQAVKTLQLLDPSLSEVAPHLRPRLKMPPLQKFPQSPEAIAKLRGSGKTDDFGVGSSRPKETYPARVGDEGRLDSGVDAAASPKRVVLTEPRSFATASPVLFISVTNNRVGSTLDLEKYVRILSAVQKPFYLVINGEPKDRATAETLSRLLKIPHEIRITASFDDFMSLIASSDAFLVGDGGVMHIAAAYDKPQVVLFGGTKITEWAPLSDRAKCLGDAHNVNFIPESAIIEALEQIL